MSGAPRRPTGLRRRWTRPSSPASLAEPSDDLVTLLARSLSDARMGGRGWLDDGEGVERVEDRRQVRDPRAGAGAAPQRLTRPARADKGAMGRAWPDRLRSGISRGVNYPSARPGSGTPEARRATGAPHPLYLGVDLGKVTTSLAVGELGDDGELQVVETRAERHLGDPLGPFLDLYRELDAGRARRGRRDRRSTASGSARRSSPACPRRSRRSAPPRCSSPATAPLNVVRVGGSGYSVLTRERERARRASRRTSAARPAPARRVEGLCARLGRTLDEAVCAGRGERRRRRRHQPLRRLRQERAHPLRQPGRAARRALPRPLRERGAQRARPLRQESRSTGPWSSIGHGALIAPIAQPSSRALADAPVTVADGGAVFEALGRAALRGAGRAAATRLCPPTRSDLVRAARSRIAPPVAGGEGPGAVVRLRAEARAAGAARTRPAVLGLDLGSTGVQGGAARRSRAAPSLATSTGAPTATRSRRRRRWSPSVAR